MKRLTSINCFFPSLLTFNHFLGRFFALYSVLYQSCSFPAKRNWPHEVRLVSAKAETGLRSSLTSRLSRPCVPVQSSPAFRDSEDGGLLTVDLRRPPGEGSLASAEVFLTTKNKALTSGTNNHLVSIP